MTNSSPPIPFDEEYRLWVLQDLAILDSDPSPEFDRVTLLAKRHFGTQFAVISLVDTERQWFKSACGLDAKETPREVAFCAHAIMKRETFTVLDATRDPRFRENPLVVGPPHIRFYAGTPIVIKGAAIGTLCVIDDKPRPSFGPDDEECLSAFAQIVEDELALREHMREDAEILVEKFRDAHRLAQAGEAAKAQFLALMSHELRTPLNAIIGFADCIAQEIMGPIDPAAYKEFAEQIAKGGRHQLGLIDRLLALTEKGRIEIEEEIIDLPALTERCIELLSGETSIAEVAIDTRFEDEATYLKADPVHIEQIALELIGNAIKFTPKGGRIRVELGLDPDDCLILAVIDSGIGIDEATLDEALDVFGQISNGLDRKYEGAGVGLPIVKKLAEMHGAELSLAAPRTGGTRAQIRFPRYRTLAEPNERSLAG